jgi:predicted ABC-type exoprotein transport system permease subunit
MVWQTIFYLTGTIFFSVLLIILTVFIVGGIYFYKKIKKSVRAINHWPTLLVPFIVILLKIIIGQIKSFFKKK